MTVRRLSTLSTDTPALRQVGAHVKARPSTMYWFLMVSDLATAIWMYTVGPWLDKTSKFTATGTLGGHHVALLVIALIGFLMLATLAVVTDNFTHTTPKVALARNLACIISIVALTGLIALILMALLSRVLFGPLRP
ncbi:hypothetical protein E1263_26075 [Kribbella antibiotica]|uniref:Uncharacterized protein n=1 Tax=Kribbella antibiotica TaxID=190195 RepID=A0A4R4ZAL9_9ACTN|nr:hypothetical protein [Kribbella antibiotica]TDD55421.1 hypothetical protein E1263_26075 [Kribbella antibiotica]